MINKRERVVEVLVEQFPEMVELPEATGLYPTCWVKSEALLEVIGRLRNDPEFNFQYLADLTAVEYEDQMVIVYHLMSLEDGNLVCLKVKTDLIEPSAPSITPLWPAADYQEREAYDLMGVQFEGHPNLKRILCPDDFEGHPLRKAFKLADRS